MYQTSLLEIVLRNRMPIWDDGRTLSIIQWPFDILSTTPNYNFFYIVNQLINCVSSLARNWIDALLRKAVDHTHVLTK